MATKWFLIKNKRQKMVSHKNKTPKYGFPLKIKKPKNGFPLKTRDKKLVSQ